MTRIAGVIAAAGLCALLAATGAGVGVAAQGKATAQRDSIIGTWTFNPGKSTFAGRKPPKSSTRTFDETRDGLILVTLNQVNADGNPSFNHWYMGFDGKEYPEFSRTRGAEPILWIAIKAVDANTKELTGRRLEGGVMKVVDLFTFKVAEDGKTLSVAYKDVAGKPTGDIVVFDKQF
jgi:hypothetical protein